MSTIASGSRAIFGYVVESTPGTTPGSPTLKRLRSLPATMNPKKNILISGEVTDHRQIVEARHGFNSVEGNIPFELAMEDYDDMLEAALSGTWATVSISGSPNLGATATTNVFTRASGSFVSDGVKVGHMITTSGFTNSANNGTFRVTAVASGSLTVDGTLVTEAATTGRTMTVPGKTLVVGTTLRTYTFERQYLDRSRYKPFRGVAVNMLKFEIRPDSLVKAVLTMLGMSFGAASGSSVSGSAVTAPAGRRPFSSFAGTLHEGGSALAVATGVDLTIDNGRKLQGVVASNFSPEVFEGSADVTGQVTMMFTSTAAYNKFVNETFSSLFLKFNDIGGTDFMSIVVPKLTFTGADSEEPEEGPVIKTLPFRSLYDTDAASSLFIQRSNS